MMPRPRTEPSADSGSNSDAEDNTTPEASPSIPTNRPAERRIPDNFADGKRKPLGTDNPKNKGLIAVQSPSNPNEYLILDEDEVPLGTAIIPEGSSVDIDEIDVAENLIPLVTITEQINTKDNPKTGEVYHPLIYAGLLLLTGALSLLVVYLKKKEQEPGTKKG